MKSRLPRVVLIVLGVIALGVGAVWVGQGLGVIPGSVMTGDRMWFTIGLVVGVIGAVLVILGIRRPRGERSGD
ncbi:MAG: hypothetical protein ABL886_13270 [Rhodoglobus sp.]